MCGVCLYSFTRERHYRVANTLLTDGGLKHLLKWSLLSKLWLVLAVADEPGRLWRPPSVGDFSRGVRDGAPTANEFYWIRWSRKWIWWQCWYQASFWRGGGGFSLPPPKKTYNPPNGCQIMCSNSFFSTGQRITTISLKYSLMDNKHRKLFVTGQSKGRKFHTFCTVTGENYCKFQKLNK